MSEVHVLIAFYPDKSGCKLLGVYETLGEAEDLCMRAARMLMSARDLLETAKDGVFPDISDDDEGTLRREIGEWLKEAS